MVHDQMISNYLRRADEILKQDLQYKFYVKRSDDTIIPVKATIQLTISEKYGLLLVCLMEKFKTSIIDQVEFEEA